MRYCVLTDMLGEASFDKALNIAVELGFDAVELRGELDGDTIDSISIEKAKKLGKLIKEKGLAVATLSTWAINPCTFSGPSKYDNYDEKHHEEMRNQLDRLMDLADAFYAENIRVYNLYREPKFELLSDDEKEKQYKHNAEVMKSHAEYVSKRNKNILVENEPPTLANNCYELGKLLEYGEHPNLKFNWDIVNGWRAGEYPTPETYEHIRGHVESVHLKGASSLAGSITREVPEGRFNNFAIAGKDDFNHKPVMKALIQGDPHVTLSIDTHYPAFYKQDRIGEVEVMKQTKEFFENLLSE